MSLFNLNTGKSFLRHALWMHDYTPLPNVVLGKGTSEDLSIIYSRPTYFAAFMIANTWQGFYLFNIVVKFYLIVQQGKCWGVQSVGILFSIYNRSSQLSLGRPKRAGFPSYKFEEGPNTMVKNKYMHNHITIIQIYTIPRSG